MEANEFAERMEKAARKVEVIAKRGSYPGGVLSNFLGAYAIYKELGSPFPLYDFVCRRMPCSKETADLILIDLEKWVAKSAAGAKIGSGGVLQDSHVVEVSRLVQTGKIRLRPVMHPLAARAYKALASMHPDRASVAYLMDAMDLINRDLVETALRDILRDGYGARMYKNGKISKSRPDFL